LWADYDKYLEEEMAKLAAWLREQVHRVNPDFLICVYVLEIGNWFCRGLARGFGTPAVPVINYAEGSYWPGYGPHVERWVENFRSWGAHVLPACAIYPFVHPPFKPGQFPAHLYNLALRAGGYWLWPGSLLFSDSERKPCFSGRVARLQDYWLAVRLANTEIEKRMRLGPLYQSPLETIEPHPTWHPSKPKPPQFEWRREPIYPLCLAGPCDLYFPIPPSRRRFSILVRAPGRGNTATVRLMLGGRVVAEASGELDDETELSVALKPNQKIRIGRIEVRGKSVKALEIRTEGLPPCMATTPSVLFPTPKPTDLIGWWGFDEGKGEVAHDRSGPPPFDGKVEGARWVEGIKGKALWFDGKDDCVYIPNNWRTDHLFEFTISAWVRLDSLPHRGHAFTIVNKGPEAPVQHFWFLIGYPPNYPLILEMGSEKFRRWCGFASPPLKWEPGRWYHVASVFKCEDRRSEVKLFRDGKLLATIVKEEAFHSGSYPIRIGCYYERMHAFHGAIDEVKFWSRALTEEEIRREAEKAPLRGKRKVEGNCEFTARPSDRHRAGKPSERGRQGVGGERLVR
ncbi:MAG TPA: LamG domain-containing protein, partial [Armatimonadetes bacterium]|nr:LamG domain-containing protein [Armatimonadota bacterium]